MINELEILKIKEKLERCKNMNLNEVDINEVDRLEDIKISKRKSSNEKMLDFLNMVTNPYIFKIGDRLVKIEFSNNNRKSSDCILKALKSIYE